MQKNGIMLYYCELLTNPKQKTQPNLTAMKPKILLSLTFLLLLVFTPHAQKSIAVMNIQSAEVDPANCIAITNYMTSELNRLVEYRIISWDDVSKMLEHHAGLQAMGCDDTECFAEIGGALGVDYIIAGDIGALGDRFVMSIRQIDINRAETVGRVSRRVTGNIGLLMDRIPEMVEEMFKTGGGNLLSGSQAEEAPVRVARPPLTPEERGARRSNAFRWTRRVVFGSVAAGAFISGVVIDQNVSALYSDYQSINSYDNQDRIEEIKEKAESERRLRNIMYTIGTLGTVGLVISIPF